MSLKKFSAKNYLIKKNSPQKKFTAKQIPAKNPIKKITLKIFSAKNFSKKK